MDETTLRTWFRGAFVECVQRCAGDTLGTVDRLGPLWLQAWPKAAVLLEDPQMGGSLGLRIQTSLLHSGRAANATVAVDAGCFQDPPSAVVHGNAFDPIVDVWVDLEHTYTAAVGPRIGQCVCVTIRRAQ